MSRCHASPFILFCHANRENVRAANPAATFGDMGRLLCGLWKELTESEKAVYNDPLRAIKNELRERVSAPANDPGLRRSARLRNKRIGLNFWGCKINNKK